MATRSHGVLINTAGLLYASLGFSLSVIAALFGVFNHFFNPPPARSSHIRHHLPRKLRGPRTVRFFSDHEHTDVKFLRRRSKSLAPIITIDHFGSVNPNFPNLLRKPVLPAEALLPNHANTDDTLMDLPTMRRPTIRRHSSSPLVLPRAAFLPEPGARRSSPVPSKKEESKSSSIKILRKTSSAADLNQESSCRIGCNKTSRTFDAFCLRRVGKKSPTLRTQPYGAPYFCTPPLPIPNSSLRTTRPEHDTQTRL